MSKFATIEEYVDAQPDAVRDVLRTLVELIDAESFGSRGVWYGHPVWSAGQKLADGPVVYVKAYTKHVTLGFWSADSIDDPRIKVGGHNMGSIKLTDATVARGLPIGEWIAVARNAVAVSVG